jgi:hypothetical protein
VKRVGEVTMASLLVPLRLHFVVGTLYTLNAGSRGNGFSIIQKTNMAARNGDKEIRDILDDIPNPKDVYAEEIGENVSFIKEKGENEDNCTKGIFMQTSFRLAAICTTKILSKCYMA